MHTGQGMHRLHRTLAEVHSVPFTFLDACPCPNARLNMKLDRLLRLTRRSGAVAAPAEPVETEDAGYPSSFGSFSTLNGHVGSCIAEGMMFTSGGGELDHATFFTAKLGTPPGNAFARLYSVSAGAPDTLLATSDAVVAASIADFNNVDFQFSGANRITLVNGTQYVVAFEYSAGDVSNGLYFYYDATGTYPGTDRWQYFSSWGSVVNQDANFSVYVLR